MGNKNSNIKKIESILSLIIIFLSLSLIAYSIPNSLTLQGKLTNIAGASQQGTFNFTFAIYDAYTDGSRLWDSGNLSITTDANGVYDVILPNLNLSFADQYYLGITVAGDQESAPRINLTSSPYSFRANISEGLKPNGSYFTGNLSISGNATIGSGTTTLVISTQLFNFSSIGNLNINGTVTAKSFVGDGSQLTGIAVGNPFNSSTTNVYFNDTNANLGLGLNNPADRLVVIGNVRISGGLNASSLNITGVTLLATNGGFVGIGTTTPNDILEVVGNVRVSGSLNASFINASRIFIGNTPVQVSGDFDLRNISNYTQYIRSADFSLANVSNYTRDSAFNASIALWNISSSNISLRNAERNLSLTTGNVFFVDTTNNRVGIGMTSPGQALHVVGSANVSTSINTPVINTTQTNQNLTISSAAGSVIIRLG